MACSMVTYTALMSIMTEIQRDPREERKKNSKGLISRQKFIIPFFFSFFIIETGFSVCDDQTMESVANSKSTEWKKKT